MNLQQFTFLIYLLVELDKSKLKLPLQLIQSLEPLIPSLAPTIQTKDFDKLCLVLNNAKKAGYHIPEQTATCIYTVAQSHLNQAYAPKLTIPFVLSKLDIDFEQYGLDVSKIILDYFRNYINIGVLDEMTI